MLGITWLELVTCIEATPEICRVYKIAYSIPFSVYSDFDKYVRYECLQVQSTLQFVLVPEGSNCVGY